MKKIKLVHILIIIIGALIIALYFMWMYRPEPSGKNPKIEAAEKRVDSLQKIILLKDSLINSAIKERDVLLINTRDKVFDDEKNISNKHSKIKKDITEMSDNESVELLRKNLSGNK